jgi:hypothetical protein
MWKRSKPFATDLERFRLVKSRLLIHFSDQWQLRSLFCVFCQRFRFVRNTTGSMHCPPGGAKNAKPTRSRCVLPFLSPSAAALVRRASETGVPRDGASDDGCRDLRTRSPAPRSPGGDWKDAPFPLLRRQPAYLREGRRAHCGSILDASKVVLVLVLWPSVFYVFLEGRFASALPRGRCLAVD